MDERDEAQAVTFAVRLTAGAHAGGVLEVRRVILSREHRNHWEARWYTLSQQIEASGGRGAWAHILQANGRRWVWTTTQGRAQLNTLERWSPRFPIDVLRGRDRHELREAVMWSVMEGMRSADPDRRSRRVSVRGVDDKVLTQEWRFEDYLDGIDTNPITEDEIVDYVMWLDENTPRWIKDAVGGLPVTREVMAMAERHAPEWVSPLRLVVAREPD